MATIETRPTPHGKTSFRAKVRLRGFPAQSATFTRLTDARRWAQATESAIREGRYFKSAEAKRHTLAELIDRYIAEVLPRRPSNARNTKAMLTWWKKQLGALTLADVTPAAVSAQRQILLDGNVRGGKLRASATVVRYLAALSHAFSIAMRDWNWVEDSPLRRVTKPREARPRCRFLSDDERDRLLAACQKSKSRDLYLVVVLALSTGMRRGEILTLRWPQVDLGRGRITLLQTKNGDRRAVHLTGHALELMEARGRVRRIDTDHVFAGLVKGKPIDITKPWETARTAAKLEDFRFHDLRHSAASYLAMQGASVVEIAEVLGHRTLQMVRRYSHLTEGHARDVVTRMNARIFANG